MDNDLDLEGNASGPFLGVLGVIFQELYGFRTTGIYFHGLFPTFYMNIIINNIYYYYYVCSYHYERIYFH